MILALILAASSPIAAPAAVWTVDGEPGSIRRITGKVKTGGQIVADGFLNDAESAADEKRQFAYADGPAGSCARAAAARPFTRLRRFAANGRLLWEWRVSKKSGQALRLLAVPPGDCLSPDGGRLLVSSYGVTEYPPPALLGAAVIAVDRRPRFVDVKGRHTGETFGANRITAPDGWRGGGDATLLFSLISETRERHDEAVLGRRR